MFKLSLDLSQALQIFDLSALASSLVHNGYQEYYSLVASYFIDHYLHDMNPGGKFNSDCYYGLYLCRHQFSILEIFLRVCPQHCQGYSPRCLANMEKLGMSYFDKTPAGSIVSRLTNDTETISEMFSGILSSFISAIFIFVTTLYTMMILDIRLTGLLCSFLPLIVLLVNLYRKNQWSSLKRPEPCFQI